ncbi:dihydropteroate synthase [Atopomonas sediminilitoris]|uniref:dihydropteroate synthase n=1 Tax=Atopomonas sediminilitoris TaxID=2919919 RepID=UPI001F4E1D4E|nr:dihydropteroate synthase [Atopomonas sediminilitoris]MCJ8170716.1 dihydropteroate synthase [Atopomonas sediminilitoris]
MTASNKSSRLLCGSRELDLSCTRVMGILNVTPDSFSDGGRFAARDAALRHAEGMLQAGADIIDVGGESTRPGARAISPVEELERVAPVVEALVRELGALVSVDTSTPGVMREAARLGAGMINDVRALQREGALDAVADIGLPVCLMHMQGDPDTMQQAPTYGNVVQEVQGFLQARIDACAAVGIDRARIVLDPGFGFGKTLAHNLSLFKALPEMKSWGLPLLVGVSRKSMIGQALNRPVEQRLAGGLALAAQAVLAGVQLLRVHDVAETVDVVRMLSAVAGAE